MSIENEKPQYHVIMKRYFHVDNGGYTFKYVVAEDHKYKNKWTEGLTISYSFYEYAENTMQLGQLNPDQLEELGKIFIATAELARNIMKE